MTSPGPNETVKILSILGQYPDNERELREQIIRESAPPGVEVIFKQYGESVFRAQMNDFHRTTIAPMYVQAALEGEREGVHAVVGFGTLDLGVEEMRHALQIPVIGTGRAGIQVARILARRFAIICYDYPHVIMYRKLLREWDGADADITSIRAIDVPLTSQVAETGEMKRRFIELARKAIDEEGAQLILPLGTMIVPGHFSAEELADEIGTTVLDVMAIGMSLGAMLARKGFRPSREAYPSDDEPGRYR
ncbi:MAG TPA: aspartate/glutamate racemase family protein [Candidatus Limnocylindrales bacterium]|nr:aspartate/glutamate racemase family protein [Candidatus Limnocylindrales bacterium]